MPKHNEAEFPIEPAEFRIAIHRTDAGQVFTEIIWPGTQDYELVHDTEIMTICRVTPNGPCGGEEFRQTVAALESLDRLSEGAITRIIGFVLESVMDRVKLGKIE